MARGGAVPGVQMAHAGRKASTVRAVLADPTWPLWAAKRLGAPLDRMAQHQRATLS
jgi:2,4-dienoyl-CoA reductase-like NADH-dependent reductase (Old Yellow Enzyme family)